MIMLLDDAFQVLKTFNTDEDLFLYLKEQEGFKSLDGQARQNWKFVQYSHKLLGTILQEMQEKAFIHMARQACHQEQDILVICKGEGNSPALLFVTPDLDIAKLRKGWCKLYCAAHNLYILTE